MDKDFIKRVLSDSTRLYSLPQTLVEVLRITKDETSSAADLAGVLVKDPAMTTKILRIVNSPFYGAGRQIGSMKQAVITLGLRQVTAVALSTSIYNMTNNWESIFDRVRFWRHSLEVAIAARTIAEKTGYRRLEEIFISGLLHDVGLLILENSFPAEFEKIWKESRRHGNLTDLEEEAWGTNHARVGQFLFEQWQLPEEICQAVGCHHNVFPRGDDSSDFRAGQIVSLANHVSQFTIGDNQQFTERFDIENREIVRENLGLNSQDMLTIEKRLFSQTINESKYLEMDIGSTEDILKEANRMLFDQYAAVESLLEENRRIQQQVAGEQVKRGFLESLKSTTTTFTRLMDNVYACIMGQAQQVKNGIQSGVIIDPKGLVDSSVTTIMDKLQTVALVTEDIRGLTRAETALYYDQQSVDAVENRIKHELEAIEEPKPVDEPEPVS